MQLLANLRVKTKIFTMTLMFLSSLLMIGGYGFWNMKQLNGEVFELNDIIHHATPLADLRTTFMGMRVSLLSNDIITNSDAQTKIGEMEAAEKKIATYLTNFEKDNEHPNEVKLSKTARESSSQYLTEAKKLLDQLKNVPDLQQRQVLFSKTTREMTSLYEKGASAIQDLVDIHMKEGEEIYSENQKNFKITTALMAVIILVTGIVGIAVGLLVTSSVCRPLEQVMNVLRKIAAGDLTAHSESSNRDELGELGLEVNQMAGKLREIIEKVSGNSESVASAAKQLSATSEEMASGAELVAAQAGSVASAGEEMTNTSGNIAQNCQFAAEGSQQASAAAMSGAQVVEETITVMNSIAERVKNSARAVESLGSRSDQIGEIVGTIEDIADQTNLLALNAAIEAARAGEQGRGFAVVADEVRALAERTTRATREIGEMIKAIQHETKGAVVAMEEGVSEVARGSEKAADSGRALEKILEQINSVTSQIHNVANSAEEQTATTSEISSNMQQITGVISQTARGAQESAAAADTLATLSNELQQIVGRFKLT